MIPQESILEIYLHPNEFYWGDGETRIKTILGSCIAICMWHPKLKLGGMSHSLLPTRLDGTLKAGGLDGKFVNEAVQLFLFEVLKSKTKPEDYKVKIFGGANVLAATNDEKTIGARNYEMGHKALGAAGFAVFSEHAGGTEARNVMLDLWSGETWLRRIQTNEKN